MRLAENDRLQYMRIHLSLMHYVGIKEKMLSKEITLEKFLKYPVEEKFKVRDLIYQKTEYINSFTQENPYQLSKEDLSIAEQFKHFKKARFWIPKYLKNYAVFLDDKFAYGVLALADPFERVVGDDLPLMVEAVLLPFKDCIVYDGFLQPYNISFGGNIRASIKDDYNEKKVKYGIITTLPVETNIKEQKTTDEDMLAFYMKTASSREQNWGKIQEIIDKSSILEQFYYQLCGKISSRKLKKTIKELGISNYYFAVYDDTIIASGKTSAELEKQLHQMLPKATINSLFIFKM
jgi:hypothetical protein